MAQLTHTEQNHKDIQNKADGLLLQHYSSGRGHWGEGKIGQTDNDEKSNRREELLHR